jgi:predicted DCC family thiol-disulfide oxidoreductase YuxK
MSTDETTYIVYDGQCPFCSRYVKLLRLSAAVGKVELVDARHPHPIVLMLQSKHVDLDDGMALVQGTEISHGDDCIHKLALMTTPLNLFNSINARLFRSPRIARLLYPPLRGARNATLWVLGRHKISLGAEGS